MKLRNKIISRLGGWTQEEVDRLISRHDQTVLALEKDVSRVADLADKTPEDCSRGEWCKTCEFSKTAFVPDRSNPFEPLRRITYCTRGDFCQNYKDKDKVVEK